MKHEIYSLAIRDTVVIKWACKSCHPGRLAIQIY